MANWYANQSGSGAADGTSAADAWAIGSVVQGASGVDDGDTLNFSGTLTTDFVVSQAGVTLKGGLFSNAIIRSTDLDRVVLDGCIADSDTVGTGLQLRGGDNCRGIQIEGSNCDIGLNLQEVTGCIVDALIDSNVATGVKLQVLSDDVRITGRFINNGPTGSGDSDGIGIGHAGGDLTNIVVHDAVINNNGPRSGALTAVGGGLTLSTSEPCTCELDILRCEAAGNWRSGISLSDEWISGNVVGNVVSGTLAPAAGIRGALNLAMDGLTAAANVCQNTVANNGGATSGLRIFDASPGSAVTVCNNIVYENGADASGVVAELNNSAADGNRTIAYNCLYNSAGENVAHEVSTGYATAALYDAGPGGGGHIDTDPSFRDPANDDYRLNGDSPCVAAGIDWASSAQHGRDGLRFCSPPSMGAYEYYGGGTAGAIPARIKPAGVDIAKAQPA